MWSCTLSDETLWGEIFVERNYSSDEIFVTPAPEISIWPVPDIVYGSRHFVPVTRNSCRSSVYDILLRFENLPVIVTGRKRILSVTHEIVPDSDRWLVVISCTVCRSTIKYYVSIVPQLPINAWCPIKWMNPSPINNNKRVKVGNQLLFFKVLWFEFALFLK